MGNQDEGEGGRPLVVCNFVSFLFLHVAALGFVGAGQYFPPEGPGTAHHHL